MRIAFFVNGLNTEYPKYATTVLARAAQKMGHDVCYITPEDFICRPDDTLQVNAVTLPKSKYKDLEHQLESLQKRAKQKPINIAEIDVLFLRNDPSLDAEERPWAAQIGIVFGKLATHHGVIVVNDPDGLGQAQNKLYFQTFPELVRPTTLISKNVEEVREFAAAQRGKIILKPLQGSGGKNVFMVKSAKDENLNQIVEAIGKEGYIIAQSYMPAAREGDIRLFVMNGQPLMANGKYAMIKRVPAEDEIRSNMHAKGKAAKAELTDAQLKIVEVVRPKLIQDGMFLVGLDIVGEKILEINVFSPGALWSASQSQGVDFAVPIIEALERKVEIRNSNATQFSNRELAVF